MICRSSQDITRGKRSAVGDHEWPLVRANSLTLSATELATIVSPPEMGEISGVMTADSIQEIPAPPPSKPFLDAPFKVGFSVAEDLPVGIDPDAHGLAIGGSRSGKTSIAYAMLARLIERGRMLRVSSSWIRTFPFLTASCNSFTNYLQKSGQKLCSVCGLFRLISPR